jgi:hypothetical protein
MVTERSLCCANYFGAQGSRVTTVSVLIPARNAAPWIREAIESVATQTLQACEIIVVDNASSDDTCAVVESLRSEWRRAGLPSIALVRNPRDLGVAASRNIGLSKAAGDWIAFLDADDWFARERLERLVALGERTGADLIADNQLFIRTRGEAPLRLLVPRHGRAPEWIDLEGFLRRNRITAIGNLGLLKPVFRRDALRRWAVRYDEDPALTIGEDALFYMQCLISGARMLFTEEALYFYRRHAMSLTQSMTAGSVQVLTAKSHDMLARVAATAGSGLAGAIEQAQLDQANILAYFELIECLRGRRWQTACWRLLSSRGRRWFLLTRAARGLANRIAERGVRWSSLRS